MTHEQQYELLKSGGAPLASLHVFRTSRNMPEDSWLTEALRAQASASAPQPKPAVDIAPVPHVAPKRARRTNNYRRGNRQRAVDPTTLYYSGLEGDI